MHTASEEQSVSGLKLRYCKTTLLPEELPKLSALPAAHDDMPGEALGWG